MSETVQLPLATQSYETTSRLASSERLLNMFFEPLPEGSVFKGILYSVSGLTNWTNLNNANPIYGMQLMDGNLYVVCGLYVYKIDSSKNATLLGTMPVTPERVMMTANNTQVTILTDSGEAFYTDGTSITQITDPNYSLSESICTIDGYTIFSKINSREFFISDLNNTASYPGDFAQAEGSSDYIVRLFADHRQLWIFKQFTTEVWYDTGNGDFPFERIEGVFLQRGIAAKFAVCADETGIYWLGDDKCIYTNGRGYQAVRISTYPIEVAIQSYSTISDCFAQIYTIEGHRFASFTFPNANITWDLNITTGLWNERQSFNSDINENIRWRANAIAFFDNQFLVGDYQTGLIYYIDPANYTEDGATIIRQIITPTLFLNYSRFSVDRLILEMDVGVGLVTGQGNDPQIIMQYSIDGGNTWSYELWQPIGEIGKYSTNVFWNRIAFTQSRSIIFKFTVSDPVEISITGAYINVTPGYS